MFVASAENDQYGLWLDGSDERDWTMPPPHPSRSQTGQTGQTGPTGPTGWQSAAQSNPQQPRRNGPPSRPPKPKPAITIEQLVQKAYYPPVVASGVQPPKQMPWVLKYPNTDSIWRNDDSSVSRPTQWTNQPFGNYMVYPLGEPNT